MAWEKVKVQVAGPLETAGFGWTELLQARDCEVGRLEEVVTVTLMPARLGSMTARSTSWATMPNPTRSES